MIYIYTIYTFIYVFFIQLCNYTDKYIYSTWMLHFTYRLASVRFHYLQNTVWIKSRDALIQQYVT